MGYVMENKLVNENLVQNINNYKTNYSEDDLRRIKNDYLAGHLSDDYKELDEIFPFLQLYRKDYYHDSISIDNLDLLIYNLLKYQKDLKKLNNEAFLSRLLQVDLFKRCVPTINGINLLSILFNKNELPFNYDYVDAVNSLTITCQNNYGEYKKSIIKDFYRYLKVYEDTKDIFIKTTKYQNSESEIKHDMLKQGHFIVAYCFYHSYDPKLVSYFLLNLFNNYERIIVHLEANKIIRNRDLNLDVANHRFEYVLSYQENRKVIS